MNLYEINEHIRRIFDAIEEAQGELPEDLEQFLDSLENERGEKLKSLATILHEMRLEAKSIKAQASVIREEYERVKMLAADKEAKADRLELYLVRTTTHGEKYDWGHLKFLHTYSVSGECKVDPSDLPPEYQRITIEPKMKELRADLKTNPKLEKYVEIIETPTIRLK